MELGLYLTRMNLSILSIGGKKQNTGVSSCLDLLVTIIFWVTLCLCSYPSCFPDFFDSEQYAGTNIGL